MVEALTKDQVNSLFDEMVTPLEPPPEQKHETPTVKTATPPKTPAKPKVRAKKKKEKKKKEKKNKKKKDTKKKKHHKHKKAKHAESEIDTDDSNDYSDDMDSFITSNEESEDTENTDTDELEQRTPHTHIETTKKRKAPVPRTKTVTNGSKNFGQYLPRFKELSALKAKKFQHAEDDVIDAYLKRPKWLTDDARLANAISLLVATHPLPPLKKIAADLIKDSPPPSDWKNRDFSEIGKHTGLRDCYELSFLLFKDEMGYTYPVKDTDVTDDGYTF